MSPAAQRAARLLYWGMTHPPNPLRLLAPALCLRQSARTAGRAEARQRRFATLTTAFVRDFCPTFAPPTCPFRHFRQIAPQGAPIRSACGAYECGAPLDFGPSATAHPVRDACRAGRRGAVWRKQSRRSNDLLLDLPQDDVTDLLRKR